jgi:glycosyltransferase involved in cell wall biosynthesis
MKVLYVITGLGVGGAERVVTTVADRMVDAGHSVKIVYLVGTADVTPNSQDIDIIRLNLKSFSRLFIAAKRLRNIILKYQPDVVHSHMFHSNILCRIVNSITPINKLICTVHNSNEGGQVRMLAYKLTNFLSDINTNVSEEATDSLVAKKAFKKSQISTVYNGIDTDYFKFDQVERDLLRNQFNITKDTKVLISIGSLSEQKDYPNLFRAIQKLANRQDYRFFIVGEGSLKDELHSLVESMGLKDSINFLGVRRDIPSLLSMADIFVLSSAWEGFGLVVAEAMSCERIVVATDCGGVKEVLGESQFLVAPQNHKALSKKIDESLSLSENEAITIGLKNRQRVLDKFSIDTSVKEWNTLYAR